MGVYEGAEALVARTNNNTIDPSGAFNSIYGRLGAIAVYIRLILTMEKTKFKEKIGKSNN